MKITKLLLAGLLLVGARAFADELTSEQRENIVNEREAKQQERIDQGVKSGDLNPKEAARLEKREEHIKKMNDKAMADGEMSKKEFKRIEHAQNKASRKVFRKKHN